MKRTCLCAALLALWAAAPARAQFENVGGLPGYDEASRFVQDTNNQ